MSDTKRILVWLFMVIWCVLSLAFDVRAQELAPKKQCSEPVDIAANTIIIKKKVVTSAAAGGGGCNDTTKDESPGGSLGDHWFGETNLYVAGSFAAGSNYSICEVDLRVYRDGTCARTMAAQIYACDAGGEATGKPTGAALATSGAINISGLGSSYVTLTFTFASPLALTSGTRYWIAAKLSGSCGGNNMTVEGDGNGAQTGTYFSTDGSSWVNVLPWQTFTFETRD